MDLRVAISIPKACAGHVPDISSAFSPPVLQKQLGRVSPFSASKRERRISPRQLVVKAASSGEYQFGSGGDNMVDANMIVLRKRMLDLKMRESSYKTPEEYMEWEKELCPVYNAHVFMAMGWLQSALINTRPIVALTLLSLLSASVSLSVLTVWPTALCRLSEIMPPFFSTFQG